MPRMQVDLPTDLREMVEQRRLPASELLPEAVRTEDAVRMEIHREELRAASLLYTAELAVQVGQPAPRQRAAAAEVARRIAGRKDLKIG